MYWPRGRVWGGSSSLNAMVYVRSEYGRGIVGLMVEVEVEMVVEVVVEVEVEMVVVVVVV